MIALTLGDVADAVDGSLADGAQAAAVVTGPVVVDSRESAAGGLFVALVGEHADGHDFARSAISAGAVAVLAGRALGVPAIVVDDTLLALGRLAAHVRGQLPAAQVIGVTGSNGKTTTKDLIGTLLAQAGATVIAPGSYNGEIGLPLSVLRADASTRYLVLEYGARGGGHIRYLTEIARPDIAVVLGVGVAHVGVFGDRAAIAAAKGELVEALPASGVAVLNADDPLVMAMSQRTDARVVTAGTSADADVRASAVRLDDVGRPTFTLVHHGEAAPVALQLYGEHQVTNATAAAAAALEVGCSLRDVAAGLTAALPASRWRMEVVDAADGVTVINDAYNANPDSMAAGLRALRALAGGRRTWAVLGPMGELGESTADAHHALGLLVASLGVDRLVVVGAVAEPTATAAREALGRTVVTSVDDVDAAVRELRAEIQPGDVVLVKASRAAGLERVAEALHGGVPVR